jgi:hypothetical protein
MQQAPPSAVEHVWDGCRGYFRRNPYRRWFDQLEAVLRPLDASYYEGTACHLDLVQWATDPTWASLDPRTTVTLLDEDVPFLRRLLTTSAVQLLLISGRAVIGEFERAFGCHLEVVDGSLRVHRQTAIMRNGRVAPDIHVIGWSLNLQSSFGVTNEMRAHLAERVRAIAGNP